MNVQDIKLEGMRILEGTHDLLEEVKYAIEQKLNLSDYSDMVRPVVLNFTTVMRICLLVGLSDKTPRSKSKVEIANLCRYAAIGWVFLYQVEYKGGLRGSYQDALW